MSMFSAIVRPSMQTFAILGSHPNLSVAEIRAVTGSSPSLVAGIGALFDDLNGNPDRLMQILGGTQKMGHVIGEVPVNDTDALVEFLASQLEHEVRETKMHFGISVYDFGNPARVDAIAAEAKHIGMTTKTLLKSRGRSARFVMPIGKEAALSAVAVTKNELTKKGAEFVLLVATDRIVVGTTAAVQDAEDWSERDFGRPRRNAKQGMLPPKLARMMLNLTGIDMQGKTVLDPFCGSGTVLMEATMLGAQKLLGGDIAAGAVNDTRGNLNWLKPRVAQMPAFDIVEAKASDLATTIPPNCVDALVTETYLGRPRRGTETLDDIRETIAYIETLYRESFRSLKKVLKGGARVVIAAPVHFSEGKAFAPCVDDIMVELGYTAVPLVDDTGAPLTYHREGQLVGRRFHCFTA